MLFTITAFTSGCEEQKDPFITDGEPFFDIQPLFETEQFPNVLVAKDGSVVATFGGVSRPNQGRLKVRRSVDGGETWGDLQILHDPIQWHGGGKTGLSAGWSMRETSLIHHWPPAAREHRVKV